jgi:rod shape-determining protein MreD
MLAIVVCLGLLRGASDGATSGFLAGIAMDLLSGAPFGMHTFAMTVVGIAAGLGTALIPREHALLLPGMAVLGTVMQQAVCVLFLRGAGWPIEWSQVLLPVVLPATLLNLLLTALLYPVVSLFRRQMAPEEPGW